jgi:uncharacterized membrane protein
MHWGFGMGGEMMFLWVIIAFVLIGMVIWTISRTAAPQQPRGETPADILRQRYVRGKITREQFEQMRNDLRR